MRIYVCLSACFLAACSSAADPIPDRASAAESRDVEPQDDPVQALLDQETLDEPAFLKLVSLNNPKLRAAERDIEAAAARARQAGLWPNPTAFADLEEAPPGRLGDGKTVVGLSVPLVFSGRLGAAVDASGRQRAWTEAMTEGVRRDLVAQARFELYRYVHARAALESERELQRIAAAFREAVAKRRAEKSVLEIDLLKSSVGEAEQEIAADTAERAIQKSAIRLRGFSGSPGFDPDRLRVALPEKYALLPLESCEKAALESHPLVRAAEANAALAQAQVELASKEAWPDLEVSAAYGRTAGENSSDRDSIVEFGVSVPLPIFNRNQGRVAEAEALRRKARIEIEDARLEVRTRVHEAYREAERQIARVTRIAESVLVPAGRTVEQASVLYREGKALVIEVLDAQRVLASNRRAHLEARLDLAAAVVALENLTGESR